MKYWIDELTFSDGKPIALKEDDIVIFVGANNSGKSASLTDIANYLAGKKKKTKVVKTLILNRRGNTAKFLEFLSRNTYIEGDNYKGYKFSLHKNYLRNFEPETADTFVQNIDRLFCNHLQTKDRLTIIDSPPRLQSANTYPSHPIHFLEKNGAFVDRFSRLFKQAFGKDIVIQPNIGNKTPLHIGETPTFPKSSSGLSSYYNAISKMPELSMQGDGMKSFMSTAIGGFVTEHPIVLIDEPEAFLHPPQAKLLGKIIGDDLSKGKQVFIATHSIDFLKGVLELNSDRVKIIRLNRKKNVNHVTYLDTKDVKSVWKDPLMKYSNVLNSVFHDSVFLCEGDVDCAFYSAILDRVKGNDSKDYQFLHCGGKDRMPMVVESLKKLNVPFKVIADIDILNSGTALKRLVEATKNDWDKIEKSWTVLNAQIKTLEKSTALSTKIDEIHRILDSIEILKSSIEFPKKEKKEISIAMKPSSAWSQIKRGGKAALGAGDATINFNILIKELEKMNIFIVDVGEVEMFIKEASNHGPKWLIEVIEKGLLDTTEADVAKEFMKKILNKN